MGSPPAPAGRAERAATGAPGARDARQRVGGDAVHQVRGQRWDSLPRYPPETGGLQSPFPGCKRGSMGRTGRPSGGVPNAVGSGDGWVGGIEVAPVTGEREQARVAYEKCENHPGGAGIREWGDFRGGGPPAPGLCALTSCWETIRGCAPSVAPIQPAPQLQGGKNDRTHLSGFLCAAWFGSWALKSHLTRCAPLGKLLTLSGLQCPPP